MSIERSLYYTDLSRSITIILVTEWDRYVYLVEDASAQPGQFVEMRGASKTVAV